MPVNQDGTGESSGRSPTAVLRLFVVRFSSPFWIFFVAAFLFDFGFGLFFFLFNLFLIDHHFNERAIGFITSALTLGNVAGTAPVAFFVRRCGLHKPLLVCFLATPLLCVARILFIGMSAQIVLSFAAGMVLSIWPICFSPTIAKLTEDANRVSGFSLSFATGIGLGAISGLAGGYLPEVLERTMHLGTKVEAIRLVLLLACGIILLGLWPLTKLAVAKPDEEPKTRTRIFHPFLFRFLPPFIVWTAVTGSFAPFAAVYLQEHLALSLRHVGEVFSISQATQFFAVLLAPRLYRRTGTILGVVCTQAATGAALLALAGAGSVPVAVALFLGYTSLMWMGNPGIYTFLMENVPDQERSTASAFQNLSGALCQAAAAPLTGACIVRFGYAAALRGLAAAAFLAAVLFASLLGQFKRGESSRLSPEREPIEAGNRQPS